MKFRCALLALFLTAPLVYADSLKLPPRLQKADKLVFCSGVDSPPMVFNDEKQNRAGVVVDLGEQFAKRLGDKKIEWRIIPFAGLIPAMLARQCDIIMDQLFDKPERREVIDMVNYMYSSQAVLVKKGNPHGIHTLDDLSGKKVAALNGSTIRVLLEEHNKKLQQAGKAPMKLVIYSTDTDAFQALRFGHADAYGTTVESAGWYQSITPDLFETGVPSFARILTGVGIHKEDKALTAAVEQMIKAMQADGSYLQILKKWNIEDDQLEF